MSNISVGKAGQKEIWGRGSRGNERGDKNLRYQRNAKLNPDDVKAKLVDPTGIVVVVLMKKYFAKE